MKKSGFDQYYDEAVEPGKRERAYAWATAIGLQDVDGLKPSKHLLATAKRHIEGEITQEEARRIVDEYGSSNAEKIAELHRRQKLDVGADKLDIDTEKLDIASFSKPTRMNIKKLFSAFVQRPFFKRKDALAVLDLSPTAVSDLLAKMYAHHIIETVSGYGKGAYRFSRGV